MNKIFFSLTLFFISFIVYGFYISQFEFQLYPQNVNHNNKTTQSYYYDYKLVPNIYTKQTSGSGLKNEIAFQANKAKLNFILVTDYYKNVEPEPHLYLNQIGVLFGANIIEGEHRFIYLSASSEFINNRTTQQLSLNQNNLLIYTHPLNKNLDFNEINKFNFNSLEVINFKSITQHSWKNDTLSTLWSLMYYPFNPRLALVRLFKEPKEEFVIFDRLSQTRKVTLFMGVEATAKAIPFADWLIKFPSYEMSFSIASQHVLLNSELTQDIEKDAQLVTQALIDGQTYISFDAIGDSTGFVTYMSNNKNKFTLGSSVKFADNLKLYFKLPFEPNSFFEVVLFRNGKRTDHLNAAEGLFQIKQPGTYRIYVRVSPRLPLPDSVKWVPWIYTNNFYVD